MKKPALWTALFLFTAAAAWGASRYAYVAGAFYPADKNELNALVDGFLSKVPEPAPTEAKLRALIVPHAGYVYSGQTAAYAYRLLQNASFDTVILLGPYHKGLFSGASFWKSGGWETPLGEVPLDAELAKAISAESPLFNFPESAHVTEHSLETQIPFLQKTLKKFKIVPLLVSDPSLENTSEIAQAIHKHIQGRNVLVIASTDMSHYHDDASARKMDAYTIGLLRSGEGRKLVSEMEKERSELCGIAATATLLELVKLMGNTQIQFLHYSTSADSAAGDKSRVVGYGALAVYEAAPQPGALTAEQGKELLQIARRTVNACALEGKVPAVGTSDAKLKEKGASFVTLKKDGELRGCIGSLTAQAPLYVSVRDMAVQAASRDPRFQPVTPEELENIRVEVSVLSEPKKVSAAEVVLGRDGVILKSSLGSGVFLPKVAEETGWTKEEFLAQLCSQKAGLPRDCWQDPATELYTFTSQDFSE